MAFLTIDSLRVSDANQGCGLPKERFYTLTHNDLTGELFLTIGSSCNVKQISGSLFPGDAALAILESKLLSASDCNPELSLSYVGWYNRLVRDEVLAEWQLGPAGGHVLHVHCHVSGEERWLAPPQLRNYIFQREMQLVR